MGESSHFFDGDCPLARIRVSGMDRLKERLKFLSSLRRDSSSYTSSTFPISSLSSSSSSSSTKIGCVSNDLQLDILVMRLERSDLEICDDHLESLIQ